MRDDPTSQADPGARLAAATEALARADAQRPPDSEAIADALWQLGRAYAAADQTPEALGAFDAIIERFSGSSEDAVLVLVGKAHRGRAGRLLATDPGAAERPARQSVKHLSQLAERFEPAGDPLAESLRVLAIVLKHHGDDAAALELIDQVERLAAARPSTEGLRVTHARVLSLRSASLARLGREDEAAAARQRLVDLYGDEARTDSDIAVQVAANELVLAEGADRRGDRVDAYRRYEQLLARFADLPSAQWPTGAEASLAQYGSVLWRDDREAEALPRLDEWLDRFGGQPGGDGKRPVRELRVRLRRARALAALGRDLDALRALDVLVADHQEDEDAEVEAVITGALVARVDLVHRLRGPRPARQSLKEAKERLAEGPGASPALQVELLYEELPLLREANRLRALRDAARSFIDRFQDSDDPTSQRGLAYAWQFRARIAWDLGDPAGETTALEAMVARLGRSTDPAVLDRVDQSRARLVRKLLEEGRYDALVAQVAAAVKRLEASQTDEELIERGRRAIGGLGALTEAHRLREVRPLAERVFVKAQPAGEKAGDIAIRALHVVAACLQEAGEQEAFEQTYDRLFEFGEHSVAMYRELSEAFAAMDTELGRYQHAFHLFGLAKALEAVGRDQECLEVIDQAFALNESSQEDGMPEMMELARDDREELRQRLGG